MIQPIGIPSAAGLDYGSGDVRHLSQGDAMDVPSLANPTRLLAQRDNLLAAKVNEVVAEVNNREQFVPLPVVRTQVPPGEEVLVSNYRVPAGYEARVLDAVIGAAPASPDALLTIYYATGYGATTGDVLVTATPGAEFTAGVSFQQTGEFIISLKNTGAATLEISASVLLAMRPLGTVGSLLIGSVVAGPSGPVGATGPVGPSGPAGSSGAGTPGMIWTGTWGYTRNYAPDDVAAYTESDSAYSSFIALANNTNEPPEGSALWDYVAKGGVTGPAGPAGATGAAGAAPIYHTSVVNGTIIPLANFTGYINTYSYYGTSYSAQNPSNLSSAEVMVAGGTYYFNALETYVESATATQAPYRGVGMLSSRLGLTFAGAFVVTLPQTPYGPRVNYNNQNIGVVVYAQGTSVSYGTDWVLSVPSHGTTYQQIQTVVCSPNNNNNTAQFIVTNTSSCPVMAEIVMIGNQCYA